MIHNWPAEDVRDLPEPTSALKERKPGIQKKKNQPTPSSIPARSLMKNKVYRNADMTFHRG